MHILGQCRYASLKRTNFLALVFALVLRWFTSLASKNDRFAVRAGQRPNRFDILDEWQISSASNSWLWPNLIWGWQTDDVIRCKHHCLKIKFLHRPSGFETHYVTIHLMEPTGNCYRVLDQQQRVQYYQPPVFIYHIFRMKAFRPQEVSQDPIQTKSSCNLQPDSDQRQRVWMQMKNTRIKVVFLLMEFGVFQTSKYATWGTASSPLRLKLHITFVPTPGVQSRLCHVLNSPL